MSEVDRPAPEPEAGALPPPLPPPDQPAFRQSARIAAARPGLFAVSMALYAAFYSLPLLGGLVQREIFDNLSGLCVKIINVKRYQVFLFAITWTGSQ